MKLFSTTTSHELSTQVSRELGVPLAQAEAVRFQNSEVRVRINEEIAGETCIIIGSTCNPTDTNLMELFFFADALKRSEAAKIVGIIPYFGYARQNIQHRPGEDVSANVIIRILETVGYDELSTFEIHDEATAGVFTVPFSALSAFSLLAKEVKTHTDSLGIAAESVKVVSPDQGGVERARHFGEFFYGHSNFEIGVAEKKRDQDHIHVSEVLNIYGDVKDKTVILVDDVTTSGGTLINAANLAKSRGATNVIAAITHHDFGPEAPQKLQESIIEAFFSTNSIPLRPNEKFDKLHEISIAPLIAEYIKNE